MNADHRQSYLNAMGIPAWEWRDREPVAPAQEEGSEAQAPVTRPAIDVSHLDWAELEAQVAACTACAPLVANRSQTVFGVGNHSADIVFVGEAPGADEDRQGEPFVGRAGKLLNEMLISLGLERKSVYIANVLKCRPPNNRDPLAEEAVACEPYLLRQLALIRPRVMVALGRIAAQNLLKTDTALARLRGQCHTYGQDQIPLVVTYHPAYLLRSPREKAKAWQDLVQVKRLLQTNQ